MSRVVREQDRRRFAIALGVIAVAALVLRLAYVLHYRRDFAPEGDAFFYHGGANLLSEGKGFISPFFWRVGIRREAAEHPPLYVVFLAVPSVLGMKSVLAHLVWSCVLGTATVVLVGLVGRAVAGARAGLIAAALAAVYPNLWAPDGQLQAETLSMCLTVLTLLLAYRYWRRPSAGRLVLVAGAAALGALARSELLLLVPLLVVPLAWGTRDRGRRERLVWTGASAVVAVAVLAPWAAYNATRFAHPVWISAQYGPLLASANCDSTYYGSLSGYFDIECAQAIADREHLTLADDESQEYIVYQREALRYVRHHLDRVPHEEGVRLLRIAGLYKTSLYVNADAYIEGRNPVWISWAALYSFWALALLSVAGVVVLKRRAHAPPVYPLLAPVVVVVVTVLVTYASTRFRTTAEPSFVVLAAVALDALWTRRRAGSSAGEEVVGVAGDDGHDGSLRVDAGSLGEQ